MKRWGFLFPGQGSQAIGMGQAFADAFPIAQETFAEAEDALGYSLSTLCFEGPKERLRQTEYTQPAVLTVSVAVERVLRQQYGSLRPVMVAGHSLGEFSALVAAGALTLPDAVRVVRERGRLMQEAVPDGVGAMAAVVGLPLEDVQTICQQAAEDEICVPANINSPQQIVISGHQAAVERARSLVREHGKRAISLEVSAPFHCPLMQPAADGLAKVLDTIDIKDPTFPVVSNVDAQPYQSADVVRQRLFSQVTSPVRWVDSIHTMNEAGITHYLELGHGRVLSGLLRRISKERPSLPVGQPKDLEKLSEWLDTSAST
ncbi:MAG TPA: [acyl-carrier-protein] S-malonyltransferase [Myxococcales bacterium]|nr:[acyl-carrier-protein] S-malonyltransferase [Deltaproteobacteria bacterium]MBU48114.1 [acyl-carrier-protein] S-malonyltransferase [Deltaproteobacteria bacterium]HAA53934.1 [acyl-carrier-protein] S-malonyltransferase [Myxococcales bacterium]|tara:strand:- start:2562 stop:3512 length:951 start_codon:yes stop_codon:yes gene_type:complete